MMTTNTERNILTSAYIVTVSALNTKLEYTSGTDWIMWQTALNTVRTYYHDMTVNAETFKALQNEAKEMLHVIDYMSHFGFGFHDCYDASEIEWFEKRYAISDIDIETLKQLAKGVNYREVLKKRFKKGLDGKKHLTESIEWENISKAKIKEMMTAGLDIGNDLYNEMVLVFTAIYNACHRHMSFNTVSDFMRFNGVAYNRIHSVIYNEKKNQVKQKDTLSKLGTKETKSPVDFTQAEAFSNRFIEEIEEAIRKSDLRDSTKQVYVVFINAIKYDLFNENKFLADVLKTTPQNAWNKRDRFIAWVSENVKASAF